MIILFVSIILGIVVWRSVIISRERSAEIDENRISILKSFVWPLLLLSVLAIIIGYFTPLYPNYPLSAFDDAGSLRSIYIIIANASYAATIGASIFLYANRKEMGRGRHILWSLISLTIALLVIVATFIVSFKYNAAVFGAHFIWEPGAISRVFLYWCIIFALVLCVVRSFRYRKHPHTKFYWLEPGFIVLGIVARIIGTIVGYLSPGLEVYAWL